MGEPDAGAARSPVAPQRPPALRAGDRVAVISPSSGTLEPSQIWRGLAAMKDLGLEPVLGHHLWKVRGHLGGSDAQRAADLAWALTDPEIDAVWCARGGFGAQRTVAALDPELLARLASSPARALIGFSDATVLHALAARLGWASFYGTMVSGLGRASDYTLAGLRAALFDAAPYTVGPHPQDPWITTLSPGSAEGPLAGGCLSLVAALVGTSEEIDFSGHIACFEEVNESPARIERYLSQLLAAGCLDGVAAIAIGDCVGCEPDAPSSLGLEQVLVDLLGPLKVPTCHFLPFGHGAHRATLALGVRARLDADQGVLEVLEAPVLAR